MRPQRVYVRSQRWELDECGGGSDDSAAGTMSGDRPGRATRVAVNYVQRPSASMRACGAVVARPRILEVGVLSGSLQAGDGRGCFARSQFVTGLKEEQYAESSSPLQATLFQNRSRTRQIRPVN